MAVPLTNISAMLEVNFKELEVYKPMWLTFSDNSYMTVY